MKEQEYKNAVLAVTHVGGAYKIPVYKDEAFPAKEECILRAYYPHIVLFATSEGLQSLKYQEVWEALLK